MSKQVKGTLISELGSTGGIEIAPRPNVDIKTLTANDPNPFFLVLEIGRNGAISKNGLVYNMPLLQSIVQQINTAPTEGILGHLDYFERGTAFPIPSIHWIGATMVGELAYAKGYIPPSKQDVREYYQILQSTGGRAATSIYGWCDPQTYDTTTDTWTADGFELEQLDLAPYNRAALQPTSEHSVVSEIGENKNMAGENATQLITEQELATLKAQLAKYQVVEYKQKIGAIVREQINIRPVTEKGQAAVTALQLLVSEYAAATTSNFDEASKAVTVTVEGLKDVIALLVQELSGPPANGGAAKGGEHKWDESPEARKKALADFGLGL